MEFPDNALTNVYKAEAIHSIRWTLYTPADPNASASTEEAQARRWIIDSSNGPSFGQVRKMRGLEFELRSKDYHVLYDADRAGVWLFDLPVPGLKSNQRETESEMIAQVVAKFAMKRSSFGCLKASDTRSHSEIETPSVRTAKSIGSLRPGQSDIEKLNVRSFNANLASNRIFELDDAVKSKGLLEAPSGAFSVSTITSNLMAAISMSLINSLVSRQDLSPIGSRSCVGSLFPRDTTSPKNNIWLDQPQMGMSLSSVLVRWSCSGAMTISIFQTVIPWLRRVSEMPTDNLQNSSSPLTRKVLISPSGMVVQYSRDLQMPTACSDSTPAPSYRRQEHLVEVKKSIAKHLALQGIHVDHEEQWLQLQQITNHSTADRLKESPRQHLPTSSFLWPAKLCFYNVGSTHHEETPKHNRIKEDTEHDPLVYAESWFKAKAKREEAVEAKREDDERSALRLQEAKELYIDENLSDFIPRTNQYLSMQEASGIYPTPPDGLRSQAVGPAVNTDAQVLVGEFAEKELTDKGQGTGMPAGSPFRDALDPDVTSARYEEADDGDLFGDMNSSLFAANGLTEADFSFFDEPRIDDGLELPLDMERTSGEITNRELPDLSLISDLYELDEGFAGKPRGDMTIRASLARKESNAKPVNMDGVADNPRILKSRRSISPYGGPLTPVVESNGEYTTPPQEERKVSFGSVLFREKLREFDDKYVTQGRFGYELEALPSSSRLRRQQRMNERMIPRVGPADEEDLESYVTSEASPDEESDNTDDGTASDVSDLLDGDAVPKSMEDAETPVSRKRKRDHEEPTFHPVTPQLSDSSVAADDNNSEDNISYPAIDLFVRSSGTFLDESSSSWLQILDPKKSSSYGKHPVLRQANRTFMQVAQILVEQLILQTESSSEHPRFSEVFNYKAPWREHSLDRSVLRDTILRFFPRSEQCTLGQYVNADRENLDLPISRQSQKEKAILSTPKGTGVPRNSLIKLQAPYTCVRRNQTLMDLLAPALHFWEELGLGPAHPSKDVTAVYIFSASQNIQHGVEMFAKMMGNTYQGCKLGTHDEASDSNLDGLVPVSMHGDYATSSIDEELRKSCEKLGTDLAKLKALGGYTVIYMINPYEDSAALAHLCVAFLKLFESYVLALKASSVENPNDLVLQIIPTSFVASPTTLVLPSPADYKRLAFEVYDRCGPSVELGRSRFSCAPSVRLARAMPKTINLKLSPETSAGLLSSDMCFHLAYSWDPTQRWLTSSWTDNQGNLQWNAPYFLGVEKSDDPWPTLLNIAKEMLDTTLEMLDQNSSTWRLFIVKDSPIHKRELEIWLALFAQHSQPRVTCTFLVIDSNPPLRFPMSISSDKHTHPTSNLYSTPNSTPAAAATYSPDPSALVSTPGGVNQLNPATPTTANPAVDPDPSAKLIDITDETWSLAFSRPLNNPLIPPHICRPVVSGYLLKRGGARDEDGLIPAQVDVVHAAEPKTGEALLEEVLAMYGALGTLARLRGIVHPVRCVLPWHVATARKANIGVNAMMEFGDG